MSACKPMTSGMTRKQRRELKAQRQLEERAEPVIPSATFNRIVDETLQDYGNARPIEAQARQALHEAAEAHLYDVFKGSGMFAKHAGRDTLLCRDVQAFRSCRQL